MPRIIEYGDRDYISGDSSGYGGGGAALVAVLLILLLYFGGFFPWISNLINSRASVLEPTVEAGRFRPIAPIAPALAPPVITLGTIGIVNADNLNMRVSPGEYSRVFYILPRGTRVEYLGETYQEPDGDLWLQVRIQSNEGLQVGWVNRRYVS